MSVAQERAAACIWEQDRTRKLSVEDAAFIARSLADSGLLVDDDTARLVALGRAVDACRPQAPSAQVDKVILDLFDAIYQEAGVEP